jgi:hypothetical protein
MRVYEGQAYVVERNKLIPQAVQLANKLYGKRCDKEESKEIFAGELEPVFPWRNEPAG